MTVIYKIHAPETRDGILVRNEHVNSIAYYSHLWYDTKGKKEDYVETVIWIDNKPHYVYEDNDSLESYLNLELNSIGGGDIILQLADYKIHVNRKSIPKHYKMAHTVA